MLRVSGYRAAFDMPWEGGWHPQPLRVSLPERLRPILVQRLAEVEVGADGLGFRV